MIGSTPVFALSGSATSSAIPSNDTPSAGEQITVDISIDVSGVDPPNNSLGSFTGSLDWNPAALGYNTNSGLLTGFTGVVNTAGFATGHIIFNGANPTGATGNITVISITFDVVGSGSIDLDLEYSAMAAAGTFTNLLPILTVTDGLVTVASTGVITTDGEVSSGTADTEVGDEPGTLTVVAIAPPPEEPAPATFTIDFLEITPDEIEPGDNVEISVVVQNTGEREGDYQVMCKINGVLVGEKEITLAGGSGEMVVFTTTFNEAGNKVIEVNELTGNLIVKEEVLEEAFLEEELTQESEIIVEIPTQDIPDKLTSTSGSYWWIIGLISGVSVLLIAIIIYLMKQKRL
jgi:hypothetical protein